MSQLVFLSVSGGSTTLNGTNTAGTYNLTVPAANGTLLYQDTSGNITFNNVTITGLLSITGTSALGIPVGNTAQRPGSPVAGMIRYNTDGGGLYEGYLPAVSAWYKFVMTPEGAYTIQYMIAAGGGSGDAGGGGAGGYISGTTNSIPSSVYTIIIGAGGSSYSVGSNSSLSGLGTTYGGGVGGVANANGTSGGSGGGGGSGYGPFGPGGGYAGQGNSGGYGGGQASPTTFGYGGGGGGASGAGGGGSASASGAGGLGISNAITGSAIVYCSGAAGGGGNGGANTGNGGGANGGSGVVILSMPTVNYTGTVTGSPTVTTNVLQTVLKFTASGSYTS